MLTFAGCVLSGAVTCSAIGTHLQIYIHIYIFLKSMREKKRAEGCRLAEGYLWHLGCDSFISRRKVRLRARSLFPPG